LEKYDMENIVLQAESRSTGRHSLRELRSADHVPAIIYGANQTPRAIAVEAKALHRVLHAAGAGLLSLQVGTGTPIRVLVREIQHHPVKHHTLHVDFQAVSMTEKLRLDVPIVPEGTAPAMANPDVVLVRAMDAVEIECLPTDIPSRLVADLSQLKNLHDEILVRDLAVPAGVKIMAAADHVVFSLTLSRAGTVEEVEAEAPAPDEVEVVAKGKAKEGVEEEAEGKTEGKAEGKEKEKK
jgi:large subunit ribosomal protein L25